METKQVCSQDLANQLFTTCMILFETVFHCHFAEHVKGRNHLVMENLRDQGYKVTKMT